MGRQKIQIHVFPERCSFFYVNNYVFKILEGKMVGWHHLLDRHEPGQTSGDGQGQGSLACCCPWGREEEDPTWQLNINNNSRTCFLPSPPPKSTKSEGPMRGAAHGRRSPSALYCGPWGGCVPQRGLLSSPLLHWPHPPQALRSLLFTALGSLCPPGPDYRGQSPGGLNGWYRFSDFVTILCWIFYTRSFGEILQPSRILLFGEKSQPHEGMDASEETVSRACAVRGWASRQLLWRVALLRETRTRLTSSWPFLTWKLTPVTSLQPTEPGWPPWRSFSSPFCLFKRPRSQLFLLGRDLLSR